MKKEEAIERLEQNKAAAEFYAVMTTSRQAAENELKDIEALNMAIEALSERTGEWIKTVDGNGWNEWLVLKCPFCGATIEDKQYRSWEYNFCPNCRARMCKGGDDE